ncbi:MAG: membrane protein insertase YidC, partial [Nitrospinota bacterium]
MSLQQRALLAALLSMLILLVWQYYFVAPRIERERRAQRRIERAKPEEQPTISRRPPAPAPAPPGGPPGAEVRGAREKEVVVDFGLGRARFTTRGASLAALTLAAYRDAKGKPVDLVVQEDGNSMRPLHVEGSDPRVARFNEALFRAEPESLILSPSRPRGQVVFRYDDGRGNALTKTLSFTHESYLIEVALDMRLAGRPAEGKSYVVYWGPGLGEEDAGRVMEFVTRGPVSLVDGKRLWDTPEADAPITRRGHVYWTGITNKYYLAALIPRPSPAEEASRALADEQQAEAIIRKAGEGDAVGLRLPVDRDGTAHFALYAGPKEVKSLEAVGVRLEEAIDYGWFSFLANPLLYLLRLFYGVSRNWGVSIILVTVLVKILFYPLTHKGMESMKRMQKLQPRMKQLREIYKNDRQRMNEELMALYREHKVNPMAGCLPMVVQIPVFFALYRVLIQAIELRGAPFFGWVTDLARPDPYHIYTILMGLSMFVQQKMTPAVGDPAQAKMMLMMPVIFTAMFIYYPMPVGLVIYWLVNNLLQIAQQYFMQHGLPW